MNRCKVSIWILLSLILLCMFSLAELQIQCREALALVEEIESAVDENNTGQALLAFDNLEQDWKHYHDINGIFVNGSELDSIREIMSGLKPLIEDEHPEVRAELQKMKHLILSVYEEELPEIWHIL
ncbi:MAG: DUF4363 family protein [Oscillospiraceae bacterium]|nr:DUF4363 family protein [Oscillospiraceae bacterium]